MYSSSTKPSPSLYCPMHRHIPTVSLVTYLTHPFHYGLRPAWRHPMDFYGGDCEALLGRYPLLIIRGHIFSSPRRTKPSPSLCCPMHRQSHIAMYFASGGCILHLRNPFQACTFLRSVIFLLFPLRHISPTHFTTAFGRPGGTRWICTVVIVKLCSVGIRF